MEATEKPIEITVAANAGVMIRAGNTVILADVLEDAGPYPFDRLPDSVLSQMAEGENPWRNAQYLIFTHEHPDHFAPDLVGSTFPGILSAAWCFPTGRTRKTKPFCRSCVRAGPRFGRCRMKSENGIPLCCKRTFCFTPPAPPHRQHVRERQL